MTNDELNERWRKAVASMIQQAEETMSRDEFWQWVDARCDSFVTNDVRDEFMEITEPVVTGTFA